MTDTKTALVISAHAADFVWRCGGAIALHESLGWDVTIVCLTFGERGESAKLWKHGGWELEDVKSERKKEAEAAAKALDATDIQFMDLGDYPIEFRFSSNLSWPGKRHCSRLEWNYSRCLCTRSGYRFCRCFQEAWR